MPYVIPSRSDYHVDRVLTNVSVAYIQGMLGMVARRVSPVVPVENQSGIYVKYNRGDWNRSNVRVRAPGTRAAVATYRVDRSTYFAEEFALARRIPDTIRRNADSQFNLDREATEFLTLQMLLHEEKTWASTFFKTGVWTNELTGVDAAPPPGAGDFVRWHRADSSPIEDVRAARTTTLLTGGMPPNKMVLGQRVWDALVDHPDMVGRIDRGQTTGPALQTRAAMAAIFELDEVLVMSAIENTAGETATPTETNEFIGGKHALLMYAPPRAGQMTQSASYTFAWNSQAGAEVAGSRIIRLRADFEASDHFEIQGWFAQAVVDAGLGFMFLDAVN